MESESYNLSELTTIAREFAKGARIDKRSVRCVLAPCPKRYCSGRRTHVHPDDGVIVLAPHELFVPKRLQEWLMCHEARHLHTQKSHKSNRFNHGMDRMMPDHRQRWEEYWQYHREHRRELMAKARSFMAEKRKVPEPTYEQKILKAQTHMKILERKIKRLTTLRSKWLRRLKAWQRLVGQPEIASGLSKIRQLKKL